MSAVKTLDELECAGRRVIVRIDLNVPMQAGTVTDATRLDAAAVTLVELARSGARVIVMSHLGRPGGRVDPALSLRPLVGPLSRAADGIRVRFAEDCVGPAAAEAVAGLAPGEMVLLENLRFHAGEEANDPAFAAGLAELGDVYVNDAFSAAHRAHASIEAITRLLPCYAGRQMRAELDALAAALESAQRPLTAIVGGAKVSTKLAVLGNLVRRADRLIIGGGMANTFLHARGIGIGCSLAERDLAAEARAIEEQARSCGCELLLQEDAVVAARLAPNAEVETVPVTAVPADRMILDVGLASRAAFGAAIATSRTVLWNGPLGAFETPPFHEGTVEVARALARRCEGGGTLAVAGGGDTVAALALAGVTDRLDYVSTAGGAFLEWLEGRTLPGVAALEVSGSP